jgi:chitinase
MHIGSKLACLAAVVSSLVAGCVAGAEDVEGDEDVASHEAAQTSSPIWVTAYYAAWQRDRLPVAEIDFAAMTHVAHFNVVPRPDGTLDPEGTGISTTASAELVNAAHAKGKKALITIGGAGARDPFVQAIRPATRTDLVWNIVRLVQARKYDGVDLDLEPMKASDREDFVPFVRQLREALRMTNPKLLLTTAVVHEPSIFAEVQNEFDQINVMTYDLSGAFPGFDTWHNSNLYSGTRFASGAKAPSVHDEIAKWQGAGITRKKLGLGVGFFGYVWSGATGPRQSIEGVTTKTMTYRDIMARYYRPERYHWDDIASAPFLTIDEPGTENDKFISFDDGRLAAMKVRYAKETALGGVIVWELGGGYEDTRPAGERDRMLKQVRYAAFGR